MGGARKYKKDMVTPAIPLTINWLYLQSPLGHNLEFVYGAISREV